MVKNLIQRFLPGDAIAQRGMVWNMASFLIVGSSGLLLDLLIGYFCTPAVLGVFNQVMALYIVVGQVGALGMQMAAVYFVSRTDSDRETGEILSSFLVVVAVLGSVVSLVIWSLSGSLGELVYHSPDMAEGLRMVAPAILFFSLNKLFLGVMNGKRYMRAFAVLQSLRYLVIVFFVVAVILMRLPAGMMMASFFAAELLVCVCSLVFLFCRLRPGRPCLALMLKGARFGAKALVGGVLGELNTKVDILVLGIFCTDQTVGIYSFTSVLAEGFYTLIVVIRNNINPMFARLIREKDRQRLIGLDRQIQLRSLLFSAAGAAGILVLYSGFCCLMPDSEYFAAIGPLALILACMTLSSTSIVKGNMLTHCGHPEWDTLITALTVMINFGCNFLLIPPWGMLGAAAATGFSYLCFWCIVRIAVKRVLEKSLGGSPGGG